MRCLNPQTVPNPKFNYYEPESALNPKTYRVPCGRCELCLSARRSQWFFRLKQETKVCCSAFFITLTYDDSHLPSDGKLVKRHCQLFLKRFRKRVDFAGIRYFLVGEYGDTTARPHYHLILFNYPCEKLRLIEDLQATWGYCDPAHFTFPDVVGSVTSASINYVCKYVLKNFDDENKRPFLLCSKGIGKSYLSPDMVEYHQYNLDAMAYMDGKRYPLPRYYRDKIYDDYLKELQRLNQIDQNEIDIQTNFEYYIGRPGSLEPPLAIQERELQAQSIRKRKLNKSKI